MSFKQQVYAVLFVLLLGCSGPSGSEFVGKWKSSDGVNTIELVRNGDSFLFVQFRNKFSATLGKDGILHVSGPFGPVDISYLKGSDTIVVLGDEFKRVSK